MHFARNKYSCFKFLLDGHYYDYYISNLYHTENITRVYNNSVNMHTYRVLLLKISNRNSNRRNVFLWSDIFSNVKNLRPWGAPTFIFLSGNSNGSDLSSIPLVSSYFPTRKQGVMCISQWQYCVPDVVSIFPNWKTSQMSGLFSL